MWSSSCLFDGCERLSTFNLQFPSFPFHLLSQLSYSATTSTISPFHHFTISSSFDMDDLLKNFANHNMDSPTEDSYKYHFLGDSPAGSEHDRPVHPAPAIPAGPSNHDSILDIGTPALHQATGSVNEDEVDYNADIDDDYDDDDYEYGRNEPSRLEACRRDLASRPIYNEKSRPENDNNNPGHAFYNQIGGAFEVPRVKTMKKSGDVEPSIALSDDVQESDGFNQYLRKLHRQDLERDELLAVCHPHFSTFCSDREAC